MFLKAPALLGTLAKVQSYREPLQSLTAILCVNIQALELITVKAELWNLRSLAVGPAL